MASNMAAIDGDSSHVRATFENVTSTDPELIFRSGSFRGSADEARTFSLFVETDEVPLKSFEMRVSIRDPKFNELDILGKPRSIEAQTPVEPR